GWWSRPKEEVKNGFITAGGILLLTGVVGTYSARNETRHMYPNKWIPSMLWAREFHDPASVKMWKEQLALEGREWIEPIPDWWPFKKKNDN
ncbi:hypothetical protein HK099_003233, partial [Clydaea vesicula]